MRTAVADGTADFRAADGALLRAAPHGNLDLPPWPGPADTGDDATARRVEWLRRVWAIQPVADAVAHASPALDEQVRTLLSRTAPAERAVRRATLSVARYLARLTGRPTPIGLLAGVAPVTFATCPDVRWGPDHRAVARADASWIADVIRQLESSPGVLDRMPVVVNSTLLVRGNRLVVPYQPKACERGTGAVEVALRYTGPVRAAVKAARAPIRFEDLARRLRTAFPAAAPEKVISVLTELVARRVLITSLHAPSTEPDALGHLLHALQAAGADTPASELRDIHQLLERHRYAEAAESRSLRDRAAVRMRRLAPTRRHPVAADLRLDVQMALPHTVAREGERAVRLLARLSPLPNGTTAWADYHRRFYQRFGPGTLVPLQEAVADSGIGWPDGYPGTTEPAPEPRLTRRDVRLLALAQEAALDGREEIHLHEPLLAELEQATAEPRRLPAHLELCARVDAPSLQALRRGDFQMTVTSVSRAAGVVTGRFLHLLDHNARNSLLGGTTRAASGPETLYAQLSFPPLDPATAHVARSVAVLPTVISLAEHRDASNANLLGAADLAIGCDGDRLYLAAPALGKRIEAWGMHSLNLRKHTPPLARLITELSQAHTAQLTDFNWGAAAHLPYLPRLRAGRVVLAPARWRLDASGLPPRQEDSARWAKALATWQVRRRLPSRVYLVDDDQRLPLNLDEVGHRALLRHRLNARGTAVLEEAPPENAAGWCGGRAHEVVIPISVSRPADNLPSAPLPVAERIVSPGRHGSSPGTVPMLFAKLYGDVHRQDTVLTEHLPRLLAQWGDERPQWWFLRYREGRDHHLRLRVALSAPEAYGEAAHRVGTWADELRRGGLLREITFATSWPDHGRWGDGAALTAVAAVHAADTHAVLAQLSQRTHHHRHALTAANFLAIAGAFTGSQEAGADWLTSAVPPGAHAAVPRPLLDEARRLADPREGFAELRRTHAGATITEAWAHRARALAGYRTHLPGPDAHGINVDAVLDALLHAHFLRACGIDPKDKATCLYLARAAAQAFLVRAR